MRHPARLSPGAGFGLPEDMVATEAPRTSSGALPLLLLVVVLAAATVWFVALPALDRSPQPSRACEVVVLRSGTTKCVRDPRRGSQAAQRSAAHAA